jgi:hypothetical protein
MPANFINDVQLLSPIIGITAQQNIKPILTACPLNFVFTNSIIDKSAIINYLNRWSIEGLAALFFLNSNFLFAKKKPLSHKI